VRRGHAGTGQPVPASFIPGGRSARIWCVGGSQWISTFWADARQTLAPPRRGKDGLLPPLLVALTAVTGLVDAFSYLELGHVFVANMTGNVVFLAFALAGVGGFSVWASSGNPDGRMVPEKLTRAATRLFLPSAQMAASQAGVHPGRRAGARRDQQVCQRRARRDRWRGRRGPGADSRRSPDLPPS
jgi:Protein of unknown function (DUF1275)